MSPSEFAFLALGLVLGIATGAAIVVIAGSRPPKHEIRLTVTRDAIPRRASTLAADALTQPLEGPAPGGPGDRRSVDRTEPEIRTIVRPAVAIPIDPEPDPLLADLAAEGSPPSLQLVLAGDHRAMLRLVDAVAGADPAQHRAWEELLTAFVEAVRERAMDLGLLDLPMGNAFWDTFTIEQCRQIVLALASTGRRFDGRDGWADGLAPTYRDLSRALADVGLEPRRIRAWPNSAEIAELFRGARVAADEAVAHWAPTLEASDLRTFLGARGADLEPLWSAWDGIRAAVATREPDRPEPELAARDATSSGEA